MNDNPNFSNLHKELFDAQCMMQQEECAGRIKPSNLSTLYGRASACILALERELEQWKAMAHASDCALHNAPALASVREALDRLGLALIDHGHIWSTHERAAYEDAISILDAVGASEQEIDGRRVGRFLVIDGGHASDCALHNGPALPVGPCDCK